MKINRRSFLATTSANLFALNFLPEGKANDTPAVTDPRATSGDEIHEPDWKEKLTITVGPANADIQGKSDKAIQAAVDYVARLGGGTVEVLPGSYDLRSSIFLSSNVRVKGSGKETILKKNNMVSSPLLEDSDWYDQEITIKDASGFHVGDSVFITCKTENGVLNTAKRVLVSRNGNRFKLNQALRKNYWLKNKASVSNLFPLLTSEFTKNVSIQNLVLDGNRQNNENMNGNYGGCIFIQDCNRYTFQEVETRNYNGDGISWQICHDVHVENCHSHDNADLGFHPGSGSQRPVIINNKLEKNGIGIFFCWGVKYGLAENNRIDGILKHGISIGHNDTNNIIRNNHIENSGINGILFRDDPRGKDFWPNRNLVVGNKIINSGKEKGIAVDIQGKTKEVTLKSNKLIENRGPMERIGIKIGENTSDIILDQNTFEGFSRDILRV